MAAPLSNIITSSSTRMVAAAASERTGDVGVNLNRQCHKSLEQAGVKGEKAHGTNDN